MKIVYLANSFPEPVESYVWEEIAELRSHLAEVLACSVKRPLVTPDAARKFACSTLYLFPLSIKLCVRATWLCLRRFHLLRALVGRILFGAEPISRKLRTLGHTWLGAYLAANLESSYVQHIHVHHGFFSSWVGLIAARILGAGFSMTLHGSDLLVRADYLDVKLAACRICFTVSDYNRRYILEHYPRIPASRVRVRYLGVDPAAWQRGPEKSSSVKPQILSVGRLHGVKNHAFLLLACRALRSSGMDFHCCIAGDGEERSRLEEVIELLDLRDCVTMLGHVDRERLPELYRRADAVVLTSRSEGIPLTLMEAMAMQRTVVAPGITGIRELVIPDQTGFLYRPNSMEEFLVRLQVALHGSRFLSKMHRAARLHVEEHFNGPVNLARYAAEFLREVEPQPGNRTSSRERFNENPLLQQI